MIKLCAFSDEAGKSLTHQVDALLRNGIYLTELRSVNGVNVADISEGEAREYGKYLDENGISVWSVGSPLGKVDIECDFDKYLNENCRHIFKLANIFKTDKVRVFSFFNAYEKPRTVFEYLRRMAALASDYGITLYHENEKDIYGDVSERINELYENVEGLKLVYDPANFILCGEDPCKTIDALVPKSDYFHIKDAIMTTGEIVPSGHGDGQIDRIISMLDGDITMTVEPHLALFDGYAAIDERELKGRYVYKNNDEAFDAAVKALRETIERVNK